MGVHPENKRPWTVVFRQTALAKKGIDATMTTNNIELSIESLKRNHQQEVEL